MKSVLKWMVISGFTALGIGLLLNLLQEAIQSGIHRDIAEIGIIAFLGLMALSLVNFCLATYRWKLISNSGQAERSLRFREVFWDRMAGYGLSYLTPVTVLGGEPVKIALQAERGIPLKRATENTLVDTGMDFLSALMFVLIGGMLAAALGVYDVNAPAVLVIIFVVLGVLAAAMFRFMVSERGLFRVLAAKGKAWKAFFGFAAELEEHLISLYATKGRMRTILLLSLLFVCMRIPEMLYIGFITDVNLSVLDAILLATLPGFALFLPIPGGVGAFENGFVLTFVLLELGEGALLFALLVRARDLILLVLGFLHAARIGMKSLMHSTKKIASSL
jgi:hypothetical protein